MQVQEQLLQNALLSDFISGIKPVDLDTLTMLCKNHDKYDLTQLNVSEITNFSSLFQDITEFNQDISNWDVSNGIDFGFMFEGCIYFNQNIGKWDISNGVNFSCMFKDCFYFNQDIGNWNMSNADNLSFMFYNAEAFNQNIGSWNVGNVLSFRGMFYSAIVFNQDLSQWNIQKGFDFQHMFSNASAFYQNLSKWRFNSNLNLKVKNIALNSGASKKIKELTDEGVFFKGKPIFKDFVLQKPLFYDENALLMFGKTNGFLTNSDLLALNFIDSGLFPVDFSKLGFNQKMYLFSFNNMYSLINDKGCVYMLNLDNVCGNNSEHPINVIKSYGEFKPLTKELSFYDIQQNLKI